MKGLGPLLISRRLELRSSLLRLLTPPSSLLSSGIGPPSSSTSYLGIGTHISYLGIGPCQVGLQVSLQVQVPGLAKPRMMRRIWAQHGEARTMESKSPPKGAQRAIQGLDP